VKALSYYCGRLVISHFVNRFIKAIFAISSSSYRMIETLHFGRFIHRRQESDLPKWMGRARPANRRTPDTEG
jgi:hypothetical protein